MPLALPISDVRVAVFDAMKIATPAFILSAAARHDDRLAGPLAALLDPTPEQAVSELSKLVGLSRALALVRLYEESAVKEWLVSPA